MEGCVLREHTWHRVDPCGREVLLKLGEVVGAVKEFGRRVGLEVEEEVRISRNEVWVPGLVGKVDGALIVPKICRGSEICGEYWEMVRGAFRVVALAPYSSVARLLYFAATGDEVFSLIDRVELVNRLILSRGVPPVVEFARVVSPLSVGRYVRHLSGGVIISALAKSSEDRETLRLLAWINSVVADHINRLVGSIGDAAKPLSDAIARYRYYAEVFGPPPSNPMPLIKEVERSRTDWLAREVAFLAKLLTLLRALPASDRGFFRLFPSSKIFELWILRQVLDELSKFANTVPKIVKAQRGCMKFEVDGFFILYNCRLKPIHSVEASSTDIIPVLKPDILVKGSNCRVVIEAKYKRHISTRDIQQVISYAVLLGIRGKPSVFVARLGEQSGEGALIKELEVKAEPRISIYSVPVIPGHEDSEWMKSMLESAECIR